ncbi:unnamed protein product [Closterium sp. NIES-65]|nr:unnamed protein product [Closterium sp. NIES-65]
MAKALPRPSQAASRHTSPARRAQKLRGAHDAPHAGIAAMPIYAHVPDCPPHLSALPLTTNASTCLALLPLAQPSCARLLSPSEPAPVVGTRTVLKAEERAAPSGSGRTGNSKAVRALLAIVAVIAAQFAALPSALVGGWHASSLPSLSPLPCRAVLQTTSACQYAYCPANSKCSAPADDRVLVSCQCDQGYIVVGNTCQRPVTTGPAVETTGPAVDTTAPFNGNTDSCQREHRDT